MADETRTYRMRRRADAQAQTRLRLTESAMHLHGTLGPSRTSMSAVAEHAGVRRSTLYRHFADEAALFDACSAHWSTANPPPDLGAWAAIKAPDERLRTALSELYAYYGRTEGMFDNLIRDEPVVALVQERFRAFRAYIAASRDELMKGRGLRGGARRRTQAAVGHAIAFPTWKSLVREQGLADAEAVELGCRLVAAAALRAAPTVPARGHPATSSQDGTRQEHP
jgi:AcrR family transcriptional regulator